jgi:hypothetical protein
MNTSSLLKGEVCIKCSLGANSKGSSSLSPQFSCPQNPVSNSLSSSDSVGLDSQSQSQIFECMVFMLDVCGSINEYV